MTAMAAFANLFVFLLFISFYLLNISRLASANDILGCGGFIKSHVSLDFSKVEVKLFTKQGSLKEKTECAPNNGYYFLPLYEPGEYILKVSPPAGWSLEPEELPILVDGTTDPCSLGQDVNFVFTGFGITGRVVTAGEVTGPPGVVVKLVGQDGEVRETVTKEGGEFYFTPVIPGKYTVKAQHSKWKLEPSSTVVQVSGGNTALKPGSLAVQGYDVRGKVVAEGRPIQGVRVMLYEAKGSKSQFRVEGCDTSLLEGVEGNPICHAKSGAGGEFVFGRVPAGKYRLVALSRSQQPRVTLNMAPQHVDISVTHDSLLLPQAFEVTGYSVTGLVLRHSGGAPMAGAIVTLAGRPAVTTDASGRYTLTNLKPQTYTLQVTADGCEFDPLPLSISPLGVVSLPDASPSRWRVCGAVTTPGVSAVPRRVVIQPQGAAAHAPLVAEAGAQGAWCVYLPQGVYMASVQVEEEDSSQALQFFPISQKVSVGHGPVQGVVFSQLKATLLGTVQCDAARSASCTSVTVTLRPLTLDGSYQGEPTMTQAKDGKYTFTEVLPGSYEVSVPTESLCWSSGRHNIAVTSTTTKIPAFVHTGYAVSFTMSHQSEVLYKSGSTEGVLQVPAGVSQHCLPTAGEYVFTPRGCHVYQPASVTHSTHQPSKMITISAVSHSVGISVLSLEAVDDLRLQIGGQVVGPLKPSAAKQDNMLVYRHTMMLAQGATVLVTPLSGQLLFSPSGPRQVSAAGGDCVDVGLLLRASKGRVLRGQIHPAIAGVTITLQGGEEELSVVTGADGAYHFGPLDAAIAHTLVAHKESYVLTGPDHKGDFQAQKLAEIIVTVVDAANKEPLPSALVSVSGGESYRRNLATGPDGRLAFPSLAPGEYYLKPLMKEYRFTPPHRIIPIKEGETHQITLSGQRVACSGIGQVTSLGGGGVGLAGVVASPADASQSARCPAEEAQSDREGGGYRVRGLLRGCSYHLSIKNQRELGIAHVIPPYIHVHVETEAVDIEGLNFVAIQPLLVTDVSVLVYTPRLEHYKTLKLRLSPEQEPTSVVYQTKLDGSAYAPGINPGLKLTLPRLPADNRTYLLQLESSLSRSSHRYNLEPVYFNADGKFKHFKMTFEPKVKTSEQELSQPSLLILPLIALILLVTLQRDRCVSLASKGAVWGAARLAKVGQQQQQQQQQIMLDDTQIDQIVQNINAVKKRPKPRKV